MSEEEVKSVWSFTFRRIRRGGGKRVRRQEVIGRFWLQVLRILVAVAGVLVVDSC